jgi:zinc-binding alcohol dehydrogenase family protein
MKAIGLYKYLPVTDPECFVEVDVPKPTPSGHDLLVRVKAVSVNPVDTKQRAPRPQVETTPKILGWDAAGVVEAMGEQVTLFKPGDEVYYAGSIIRPGCNSEWHLVDERIVGHKPRTLTFEQAAAMPLTTLTAWEGLFERLGIAPQPSEQNQQTDMLIIGGAGGVGSIAIQLAKRVAGVQVIATASRTESSTWCQRMGAAHVINHQRKLSDELKRIGVRQVAYILCTNSIEQYFEQMAEIIAPFGRICTIVGFKQNQPINLNSFFQKSVSIGYELMYTRSTFKTPDMQRQHDILNEATRLFDAGVLQTTLTETVGALTAENLRRAHAKLEAGTMIGKLALSSIAV